MKLRSLYFQHLRDDNAAGPIRAVADRTRDLLGVVSRIAEILTPSAPEIVEGLSTVVDKGIVQLEIGVPESAVWLVQHVKRLLTRGDYLALVRAGLNTPQAIQAVGVEGLTRVIVDESKRKAIMVAVNSALADTAKNNDRFAMPAPPPD
jgi:helicase